MGVERGVYRQPDGKLGVRARGAGRLHFRTCEGDLEAARRAREELVAALAVGRVPASPRLRLDTVAARWSARFEAMATAEERHRRTCEAHRFHLDHDLRPRLGHRRISSLTVDDVADLIGKLRAAGRSPKTTANALATLQSVLRFANACLFVLLRIPDLAGAFRVLDADVGEETNLNRYGLLRRSDLDRPKVEVLADHGRPADAYLARLEADGRFVEVDVIEVLGTEVAA